MESLLESRFSDFVHSDTVATRGPSDQLVYAKDVYNVLARDLEPIEGNEAKVEAWLRQLTARAPVFALIDNPTGIDSQVVRRLERLAEWDTVVISHLVYLILLRHQAKRVTATEAAECLKVIESYLVRRMVANIPTNQLNRIFIEITPQVAAATDVAATIRNLLSVRARRWPDDDAIRTAVKTQSFYQIQRPAQRQFVLRRLAEELGEFEPDWARNPNTEIEHIMPQTLTPEWLSYLMNAGESDPTRLHTELVDTIGNLTLTVHNQSLSQKLYEDKRAALASLAGEPLVLTKRAYEADAWTAEAIASRSAELGELIIRLGTDQSSRTRVSPTGSTSSPSSPRSPKEPGPTLEPSAKSQTWIL